MSETDTRLLRNKGDGYVSYKWDHDDGGKYWINHVQDVEPYLERNKQLANSGWDGYDADREMRHIGSIPNVVIMEWKTKYGVDVFNAGHADAVKRLLNDPDYMWLNPRRHRLRG